jgi:hypothetical protein
MARQERKADMSEAIELYRYKGPTDIIIRAGIDENGAVRLDGHDFGEGPQKIYDRDEFEYWAIVPGAHKDRVVLALIEKLYSGNPSAVREFIELMKAKDIPCEFGSWP